MEKNKSGCGSYFVIVPNYLIELITISSMKGYISIVMLFLLCGQTLFAQNDNAHLLVQSPDGKKVMLVWFVKTWNNQLTGFDIKRKEGLQDWVKLNSEPIIPGISMKKKLSVVAANKDEESLLKARLFKLLSSHKLKETENTEFFQKLIADEKALQEMCDKMAHDYEFALMNGFAYIDYSVKNKTDYQYGLFIQGTGKMLAASSWNYGEIPDLNTVQEITSRASTTNKGVQVIWNADINKMKAADVTGFNIYRQGIRLNDTPITAADSKDPAEFTWNDKSANSTIPLQYSISAESIFGIEGIIRSYTYNPADHPNEYKKAEVTEVTSLGYYFKEGINVKWSFPKEYERFLKGFYLGKDNMPSGYVKVSSLLDPALRSYTDKTPSPVSSYMRFHVVAVYNDRTLVPGIERLYNYFPINEPPAPQNLKVKQEVANKENKIHLTWDPPMKGDTLTVDYNVYGSDPVTSKFSVLNLDHRVGNRDYTFFFKDAGRVQYSFYVSAISKSGAESIFSDTVTVQTPGADFAPPVIIKVEADSNKAVIKWQYNDITGVKGFRLFQNKVMIAGEQLLNKNSREYIMPVLREGAANEYSMQAVKEDGSVSEHSKTVTFIAPAISK